MPKKKEYKNIENIESVEIGKNMSNKNINLNQNGGCFHGSCKVLMGDESQKLVKHIKRGDIVMSFNKKCVKVLGVMITKFPNGNTDLVKIGNLLITPYHPVLLDNTWTYPKDIIKPHSQQCSKVYTFALESDHIMFINSIPCACLGHNIRGPVISHNYFGTDRILNDLSKFSSWEKTGVVELYNYNFYRDPVTKLVDGINVITYRETAHGFYGIQKESQYPRRAVK